jgi:hypothetical protein
MGIYATCLAATYANTDSLFAPVNPPVYGGGGVLADVSEQSSSLSKYLVGRIAEGWELVQPLPVRSEWDGDLHIVSDSLFSVYGDGDTEGTAQEDYVTSLIEYYQLLGSQPDNVFTRALLQKLRRYLQRV